KWPEAATAYQEAIAKQATLVADFPGIPHYRQLLAGAYANLGNLLSQMQKFPEAEEAQRQAFAVQEKLANDYPEVADYRLALAGNYVNFGIRIRLQGNSLEAADWFGKAIRLFESLLAKDGRLVTARKFLANAHGQRAHTLGKLNRHAEALK